MKSMHAPKSLRPLVALFILSSSGLSASAAHARGLTTLPIVTNYEKTEGAEALFREKSPFEIPAELIDSVTIATPNRAYTADHPGIFLQNDRMVVCYQDCSAEQPLAPQLMLPSGDFVVGLKSAAADRKPKKKDYEFDGAAIRLATTYYWVDRILTRFEEMGHRFSHRLVVRVDADIRDLETGAELTNNAFFMDTQVGSVNWSLTFLPEDNGLLTRVLMGGTKTRKTSWDPSVAMHEATHFVFQEAMGPILNSEIYGLHEAFADYFAMAILDSAEIGRIFFAGKPLRTAKELLKYTPDMEAHDLGNVVVSALWNIRELFAPELHGVVDAAAYETIRGLSANPYAEAGAVVGEHLRQLESALEGMVSEENLARALEASATIRASTELPVHEHQFDLSGMQATLSDEELAGAVTFTTWLKVPPTGTTLWGMKPVQKYMATLIARREGPVVDGDTLEWMYVAIQNLDQDVEHGPVQATPLWVLVSSTTGGIRAAYSMSGVLVTQETPELLAKLYEVAQVMPDLNDYAMGFGADVAALLFKGSLLNVKAKKIRANGDGAFSLGFGEEKSFLPMTEFEIKVRPTFIGWILSLAGEKTAKSINTIRVYGVPAEMLPDSRLPELPGGLKMVGYEIEKKTGVISAVRLESLTVKTTPLITAASASVSAEAASDSEAK